MLDLGKLRLVAPVLAGFLVLSIVSGTAIAEESAWTNAVPAIGPSGRGIHDLAYDAESDRVVLFGGTIGFEAGQKDDTWAYDFNANAWTNRNPGNGPSPRGGHAMAYDAESDRVILFGGDNQGPETWAYDYNGNVWTNMSPVIQPTAWYIADMAYDGDSDRIVLFGGCAGSRWGPCDPFLSDETWSYDYNANTWTNMNPVTGPGNRILHRLAYDAESDRIVLFGGGLEGGRFFGDTWVYDLNTNVWTQMAPAVSPLPRCCHAMAYDTSADRIVLFGGYSPSPRGDTWTYDFSEDAWVNTDRGIGPSGRASAGLEYDIESGRIVLFGGHTGPFPNLVGNDETWAHQLVPSPGIDLGLVAIVMGVVAAAAVAVVLAYLARRRVRMREGGRSNF